MQTQDDPEEVRDLSDTLSPELHLEPADLESIVPEVVAYQSRFAPLFARPEQRVWAALYLQGLLVADVPRKNIEALVLRLRGAGPGAESRVRSLQYFVGTGVWEDGLILAEHQRWVDETLGEDDGVLIIDGSDMPKQGTHSAGVARQWCGATGKKDNCQAGVFVGYASRKGATLLAGRLYLPASWFTEDYAARWRDCGIPVGTPFQTKPALAGDLVAEMVQGQRVRTRYVTCDEGFGNDPALLARLAELGLTYLAEVSAALQVWPLVDPATGQERSRPQQVVPPQVCSKKGPAPRRPRVDPTSPTKMSVATITATLPASAWQRYRILEGSKGPLMADFAVVRAVAVRDRLPGAEVWVVLRRKVVGHPEVPEMKYYVSNAPVDTPLETLVWLSGMRWPIESCFAECKGELGMDHYELRFWRGWHHHMTLVFLAHHFLVQLQQRLDQRGGGLRDGRNPSRFAAADDGASGPTHRDDHSGGSGRAAASGPRTTSERGGGAGVVAGGAAVAPAGPRGRAVPAALPTATEARRLPLPSPPPPPRAGQPHASTVSFRCNTRRLM